jgi:hypothetical protein
MGKFVTDALVLSEGEEGKAKGKLKTKKCTCK